MSILITNHFCCYISWLIFSTRVCIICTTKFDSNDFFLPGLDKILATLSLWVKINFEIALFPWYHHDMYMQIVIVNKIEWISWEYSFRIDFTHFLLSLHWGNQIENAKRLCKIHKKYCQLFSKEKWLDDQVIS